MTYFQNKLWELNISTGLVRIQGEQTAEGNLDYCVAVNTLDRGIVFLTVMPESLTAEDREQNLQLVYLMEGERIGLLPAKLASSNDYAWYASYLDDVYAYYDRCEYLAELSDLLDRFVQGLDNIRTTMLFAPQGDIDRVSSLVDEYNRQTVRYNELLRSIQVDENQYPESLYYIEIEEQWTDTWGRFNVPVPPPLLSVPTLFPTVEQLSSQMQKIVLLSESTCKVERVTDKNFIVNEFKIKW